MSHTLAEPGAGANQRAEHEGRNSSASAFGVGRVRLVEGHKRDAARQRGVGEERTQESLQPVVGLVKRAVVRGVAAIRNDEREIRKGAAIEIRLKSESGRKLFRRLGDETMSLKYRSGLWRFRYLPLALPRKRGLGKPSAYTLHDRPDASTVSARFAALTTHEQSSLPSPCVEPETSAM